MLSEDTSAFKDTSLTTEDKVLWVDCDCSHFEHSIRVSQFANDPEVYIQYFLQPNYSWWERIGLAIKYVFGYVSKNGHFGETVLTINSDQAKKLAEMIAPKFETKSDPIRDANTYFPLLICYEGSRKPVTVNSPIDIESGRAFKVLKTKYEG